MPTYPKDVVINKGAIGGTGGGAVEFLAQTGGLVERVGAWVSGKDIIGVSIKFTNDEQTKKMGSGGWGDYSEFIFEDPSETVKSLSLWGNGKGTNLGRIKFTTSKGRTFECGPPHGYGGSTEYPMDVGSGLWVGIGGSCGATVDAMSVFFLGKVDSMRMKEVKFKNDPTGTSQGIKPSIIEVYEYPWRGIPFDFKADKPRLQRETHTVTETKSHTTAFALGFTEEWKGEVNLFIAKTTLTIGSSQDFSYTWTTENSTTNSKETEQGQTAGVSGHVQSPEEAVFVEAITYTGSLDLEYTATIEVKMASGATYNIPTNGTMKKQAYSKIEMNVRPIGEAATLPPKSTEARSLEEEPYEENPQDRSGEEQYQGDEETAWTPAENTYDNDERLEARYTSQMPADDTYERFDESREQDEELQEDTEKRQRRGYDQQEYEAQNDYGQEREGLQNERDNFQSNQNDIERVRGNYSQRDDGFYQNQNDYEQDQDNSQQRQNQQNRSNDYEAPEERNSDGRYPDNEDNESLKSPSQEEDSSNQQWNPRRQDNTENYDSRYNDQYENQAEQNTESFDKFNQDDGDRYNRQDSHIGRRYDVEQTFGEDERSYAPVEREKFNGSYDDYGYEKEQSGFAEEEDNYRGAYQQQGNRWRENRNETEF